VRRLRRQRPVQQVLRARATQKISQLCMYTSSSNGRDRHR
jgi:hypothetical protein